MAIGFPVVVGEAAHSVLIGSRPLESSKGGIWFNGLPAERRFPGVYKPTFNRFRSGISLELVIHAPEVVTVREGDKLIEGGSAIAALLLASHYDCAPLARVLVSGRCDPDAPGHFERMPIIPLGKESQASIKCKVLGFGYSLFMHEDDLVGLNSVALEGWQPESPLPQVVRIPRGMLLGELAKVLKVRSFDEIEREQRAALRHPAVVPVGEGRVDRAVARIINERTERFFGREAEQATLDSWLQSSDRGIKLVLAPAGLGKSALLANWIGHRREHGDRLLQHFFAHRLPESVEATSGLDYLWRQLQELSGQTQPSAPLDRERLGNALAAELGRDQSQPLILVLDGLDEAGEDFPNFLPAGGVGRNVHVVLGVRDDGTERIPKVALRWLAEQDAEARRKPVYLKPLNLAAIRAWLLAERPDLAESDVDPWLRQLMTASDGLPLFLHFLFDDVRSANFGHGRLPILPERFRDYLQGELERMRQSDRGCWMKLFALLTRTFGPIAQTELAKLKDEDGLFPFRELSVQVADSRILRWLSLTGEERNPSYSFVHPRFAQAFADVLPVVSCFGFPGPGAMLVKHWRTGHAEEVGVDARTAGRGGDGVVAAGGAGSAAGAAVWGKRAVAVSLAG